MDPDSQVKNSKWTFYNRFEYKTVSIEPEYVRIHAFCHHFSVQRLLFLLLSFIFHVCTNVLIRTNNMVRHVIPAL